MQNLMIVSNMRMVLIYLLIREKVTDAEFVFENKKNNLSKIRKKYFLTENLTIIEKIFYGIFGTKNERNK